MTKTLINEEYTRRMSKDVRLKKVIAELEKVELQTVTNWVRFRSPKLTSFDIINLLEKYYEVNPSEFLEIVHINNLVL
jgi:hypothetical protein